ncbi:carboxypeptidase regulatory-like domain-containing protein [Paraburkholderia sp. MMS20-SJTR3]|uniref:Carboxypeptidase regulatory-like domain-containing protein n=1 Tax=Paraburkholderia sejongensis TaxID=2886946 RepID=A0ABS8K0P2_9BURK|nr:carboxypeptidase regulatory-like domain-containing protein [Paraburkholderia sp. MMS20-SJTR3]MCC8395734.1 carboxypeptidase regulatory-like domain-containing protein [Paraburkholderia sp. MMS20-SJTR3]
MKMQHNAPLLASTLLVAAFALGQASGAIAQTASQPAPNEIHRTGMPPTQQQGDVSYVTGGVGRDESAALRQARRQWPLSLQFTGPGSSYVADVQVRIAKGGTTVLDTTSKGPYLLARVPPGRYTVTATYGSVTRKETVNVHGNGSGRAVFSFPSSH